jgi:hypothetical protein
MSGLPYPSRLSLEQPNTVSPYDPRCAVSIRCLSTLHRLALTRNANECCQRLPMPRVRSASASANIGEIGGSDLREISVSRDRTGHRILFTGPRRHGCATENTTNDMPCGAHFRRLGV